MNIYQRILSVMAEVAYIKKEDKKVNNMYTFVSHDEVSRVLHPMLVKHGIVVIPSVTAWVQDGNRTSADVTVSFVNADKPEDRVDVNSFGFGIDPQDKGPGKAVSYATKYAMLKTFVLETGDDPERDSIPHESENLTAIVEAANTAVGKNDWVALCLMDKPSDETWLAAWGKMGSKQRKAIKDVQKVRDEYRDGLNACADLGDAEGFKQLNDELSLEESRYVYGFLSAPAQTLMTEQRKAA